MNFLALGQVADRSMLRTYYGVIRRIQAADTIRRNPLQQSRDMDVRNSQARAIQVSCADGIASPLQAGSCSRRHTWSY
jgi:hypothetical protein